MCLVFVDGSVVIYKSKRGNTRFDCDWSSDVCSSDLEHAVAAALQPRYLDDLAVGDQFKSGEHAMDEAQIKTFATQFDPQPFHLDDTAARDTLFGGLAASGWHTAAVTMRLQDRKRVGVGK